MMNQKINRTTMIIAICVALLMGAILPACADDKRPITAEQLPAKSQTFLKTHFSGKRILLVTLERGHLKTTYEVRYADGTGVEFRKDGGWKEVDCRLDTVPAAIVPQPVLTFVAEHYPDSHICKVERDRKGYEVKLSNRLELAFDPKFRLMEVDD